MFLKKYKFTEEFQERSEKYEERFGNWKYNMKVKGAVLTSSKKD